MIYLASPYAKYPLGLQAAYERVSRVRQILEHKHHSNIFSPIEWGHPISQKYKIEDGPFWLNHSLSFLRQAEALWLYTDSGWHDSSGMKAEVALAVELSLPIKVVKDFGHENILLALDAFSSDYAEAMGLQFPGLSGDRNGSRESSSAAKN